MKGRVLFILLALTVAFSCNKERVERPTGGGTGKTDKTQSVWYVSPDGSDSNSGISPSLAFRTLQKAVSGVKPGDVVKVLPGNYVCDGTTALEMKPEHSGREGQYVTIQAKDPDNRPVFTVGGHGVWNAIDITASYVIIDGLEFWGYNERLDSLEAYTVAYNYWKDNSNVDWSYAAQFNTNCISIGDKNSTVTKHVVVRNCVIHDFPGCGIGATTSDYITVENNVVYNNSWFCMFACSGISYINPLDSDSETGYKMSILNNLVYNNHCKIPWVSTSDFSLSDGNGIILDVNQEADQRGLNKNAGPYKGRTLVANNVSINNGGSGIHSYRADHIDIINNTAYWNGRKYPKNNYAEIYTNRSYDNRLFNNIMVARAGAYCTLKPIDNTVEYSHNILCGGTSYKGPSDIQVSDAGVVKLTRDGAIADMHLLETSPARAAGTAADFVPKTDMDGVERSGVIDCGAYQFVKK